MDDLDMSLAKEIISLLPKNKIEAVTAKALFEKCKYAVNSEDVSKGLSALFASKKIHRFKEETDTKFRYFLDEAAAENKLEASPISDEVMVKKYTKPFKPETAKQADKPAAPYEVPTFLIKKDDLASADSMDEKLGYDDQGDYVKSIQKIGHEILGHTEEQKNTEAKILKLDLPQRIDAEFCINILLKIIPPGHSLTINNCTPAPSIEIEGITLADPISPDINKLDVCLSAIQTINEAMQTFTTTHQ